MASTRRRSTASLKSDVFERPQAYELFQALRLIETIAAEETRHSGLPAPDPIGHGVEPDNAPVNIRAAVPLGYASSEVSALNRPRAGGPMVMTQTVVGLTGPSGVLPHAFSEIVHVSVRDRNPGLREFLDLFNNRLAGLLYDAWAKYRPAIERDRAATVGTAAPIDRALRAVVGIAGQAMSGRTQTPDATLVRFGGLLGRVGRSAASVERVLSGMLGHPVRVGQFDGEWLPIDAADRTRLPGPDASAGIYCRLGEDMVVGERTFDIQSSVMLHIGPLHYDAFRSLLPDGARARTLADLAAIALGPDKAFRVRLALLPEDVPPLRLMDDASHPEASRLGWNTWLGARAPHPFPVEAEFRPSPHLR